MNQFSPCFIPVAFLAVGLLILLFRKRPGVPPERSPRTGTGDDAYDATMTRVASIIGFDCGVDPNRIYPEDRLRDQLSYGTDRVGLNESMSDLYELICDQLHMRASERSYEDFMACQIVHDVVTLVGDPLPPLGHPPYADRG